MDKTMMNKEKREFIIWFLKNHRMKKIVSRIVLNDFVQNDNMLERIKFVDHNEQYENYLEITAEGTDGMAIYYSKGDDLLVTNNHAVVYSMLKNMTEGVLYINLKFEGKQNNEDYTNIIKLNNETVVEKSEELNETLILLSKKFTLLEEIDRALDERNENRFLRLTKELKNSTFIV